MSIVADTHPFVVGVDTHARKHVYIILNAATGTIIDTNDFPTTAAGINQALAWAARRTEADADTLWVIEGAASYGAILTGTVAAHGYPVAEAPRMDAKHHYGVGKSDALDAHRIAAAALPMPATKLRRPRLNDGVRQAIQVLVTARHAMTKDRTRTVNALTALVRTNDLGMDARRALSKANIAEIARWRTRNEELASAVARAEAVRLANHAQALDTQLLDNEQQLDELVRVSEASRCWKKKDSKLSALPNAWQPGPTMVAFARKLNSPPLPGSTPSQHLPVTPSDIGSTAAGTEG